MRLVGGSEYELGVREILALMALFLGAFGTLFSVYWEITAHVDFWYYGIGLSAVVMIAGAVWLVAKAYDNAG